MFASGFCGNEPKKAFRTLYEMIKGLMIAIGGRGKLGVNGMNSTKINEAKQPVLNLRTAITRRVFRQPGSSWPTI
jgi:hypothetical protein